MKRINIGWIALVAMVISIVIMPICLVAQAGEKEPKEVNIVFLAPTGREQPYVASALQAIERLQKEKPHGVKINVDVREKIDFPDAERILRTLAESGKYDIIWNHANWADAVEKVCKKYPEILWVMSGYGNHFIGNNTYWVDMAIYEPAYLMGIMAAMMTKADSIGIVAGSPTEDIVPTIHGLVAGARSITPKIRYIITYIGSLFDPQKAKEAVLAQIAEGADIIYAESPGALDTCVEKGVYCFGNQVDQNESGPDVVLTSPLIRWDPLLSALINEWWDHVTTGAPYNAPDWKIVLLMKDGGSALAPYHNLDSVIPQKVKDAVNKAKKDILSGKLVVSYNRNPIYSSISHAKHD